MHETQCCRREDASILHVESRNAERKAVSYAGHICRTMLIAVGLFTLAASARGEEPKGGGILRLYHRDSPGSPSILEESSNSVTTPFLAVFNNLILYDQNEPRNTFETMLPSCGSTRATAGTII